LQLYKYRAINDRLFRFLERPEHYFASPSSFNDPYEFDLDALELPGESSADRARAFVSSVTRNLKKVQFRQMQESVRWQDLEQKERTSMVARNAIQLYDRRARILAGTLAALPSSPDAISDTDLQEVWRHLKLRLMETYGVLSLSASPSNMLMWSHYADSHKGVCLQFDTSITPVPGWKRYEYRPVQYRQSRGVDVLAHDIDECIQQLIFSKGSDWSYEEEHRLVTLRGPGLQRTRHDAFTGIIIGARAKEHKLYAEFMEAVARHQARRRSIRKARIGRANKVVGEYAISIAWQKQ
jgi:hypothetical protein